MTYKPVWEGYQKMYSLNEMSKTEIREALIGMMNKNIWIQNGPDENNNGYDDVGNLKRFRIIAHDEYFELELDLGGEFVMEATIYPKEHEYYEYEMKITLLTSSDTIDL